MGSCPGAGKPVFAVVGKVGLVAAVVLGAVDGEAVEDPVDVGVAAGNEACVEVGAPVPSLTGGGVVDALSADVLPASSTAEPEVEPEVEVDPAERAEQPVARTTERTMTAAFKPLRLMAQPR